MIFAQAGGRNATDRHSKGYVPLHQRRRLSALSTEASRGETITRSVDPDSPSRLSVESIHGATDEPARPQANSAATPTPYTTLRTSIRVRTEDPATSPTASPGPVPEPTLRQHYDDVEGRQPAQDQETSSAPVVEVLSTDSPQSDPTTIIEVNPPLQTILGAPNPPQLSTTNIASILVGATMGLLIIVITGCVCLRIIFSKRSKDKEEQKKKDNNTQNGEGGDAAPAPAEGADNEAGHNDTTRHEGHHHTPAPRTTGTNAQRNASNAAAAATASGNTGGGGSPSIGAGMH
ncbi:hypothetical protein ABKA04_005091 [Annulohypoxylon sp. FPYF3050]